MSHKPNTKVLDKKPSVIKTGEVLLFILTISIGILYYLSIQIHYIKLGHKGNITGYQIMSKINQEVPLFFHNAKGRITEIHCNHQNFTYTKPMQWYETQGELIYAQLTPKENICEVVTEDPLTPTKMIRRYTLFDLLILILLLCWFPLMLIGLVIYRSLQPIKDQYA